MSPDDALSAFLTAVGGRRIDQPHSATTAWSVELPLMPLRFPRRTAVAIITGVSAPFVSAAGILRRLGDLRGGPRIGLVIDLTAEQNATSLRPDGAENAFVTVSARQLGELLESKEPLLFLGQIIASQLPLAELSRYRARARADRKDLSFGREDELQAIEANPLRNRLIVGPPGIGKTTLLGAVQKRLQDRRDLVADSLRLDAESMASPTTLDQRLVDLNLIGDSEGPPRVWLVDDADRMAERDTRGARAAHFVARAMQLASLRRRAYFVLAGAWDLYEEVILDPAHPLHESVDLVRLGPLSREAARQLLRGPMERLGLSFENEIIVERILDETACLPNLISAVCRGIIDELAPGERLVTPPLMSAALFQNVYLQEEVATWELSPLAVEVVQALLKDGSLTVEELRERFRRYGVPCSAQVLNETLDRLHFGLVVVKTDETVELATPIVRCYLPPDPSPLPASGFRRPALRAAR